MSVQDEYSLLYAIFPAFLCALGALEQNPRYPVSGALQAILWVHGLVKDEESSLDYALHETGSIMPQQQAQSHRAIIINSKIILSKFLPQMLSSHLHLRRNAARTITCHFKWLFISEVEELGHITGIHKEKRPLIFPACAGHVTYPIVKCTGLQS